MEQTPKKLNYSKAYSSTYDIFNNMWHFKQVLLALSLIESPDMDIHTIYYGYYNSKWFVKHDKRKR